jgi:DNA-binding transcriptional ArsR family regulator
MAPEGAVLSEHELLARIFRTLGESRRLRIVELLLEHREMSQSELFERLGIPQSRASDHLQCLVWCGFLQSEKRGRRLFYRIADRRAGRFIRLAREFLQTNEAGIGTCHVVET